MSDLDYRGSLNVKMSDLDSRESSNVKMSDLDGAWSEVFSQLPETDRPGPEETEEGRSQNLYAPSWWQRQVPFMRQLIGTIVVVVVVVDFGSWVSPPSLNCVLASCPST